MANPWDKIPFIVRKKTDLLVVHCAATEAQDFGAKEIDVWHRKRGFVCIGYHFVIRRDGTVEFGRPSNTQGAHVQGYNHRSIGICLMGGGAAKENRNFTSEQYETLEKLIRDIQGHYVGLHILGHRDIPKVDKWCPSFDVREWATERNIPNAPVPNL